MTTISTRDPRSVLVAIAACTALASTAASVRAAPPGTDAPAIDHDEVFRRGLALYTQGHYLEAIGVWEKLLSAMGEQRGWKMLYNLGLAHQKVGDATLAILRLEAFVRRVGEQPGAIGADLDERRQDAVQRVSTLKAELGALHVIAPPGDQVALVRVGSAEPRPAGFTVYLAPGDHDVELYTGTTRAARVTVKLDAGATRDLVLVAAPPAPAPPQPASVAAPASTGGPPPPSRRAFPVGWAIAGGVATLAAGAVPLVFGLRAASKRDDADRLGAGSTRYDSAASDYDKARTVYYFSYAVPAAIGIAATAIVLVQWSASGRGGEQAAIVPCLPGGLCASGRF